MERLSREIVDDKGELYLLLPQGRRGAKPVSSPLRQKTELQALLCSARSRSFYVRLTPMAAADLERAVDVVVELASCGCTASLVSAAALPSSGGGLY